MGILLPVQCRGYENFSFTVAKYRRFAEQYGKLSEELTSPKHKEALKLMARASNSIATECQDVITEGDVTNVDAYICGL
jgi:hypothetical protein